VVKASSVLTPGIRDFTRIPDAIELPHLLDIQRRSFEQLLKVGVNEMLAEFSPIEDPGGKMDLYLDEAIFEQPKITPDECREQGATYAASLKLRCRLVNRQTGEILVQDVFAGEFPMMGNDGVFIINGT
jgi:DNA-directed RNA polymerase subunit beta